MILKNYCQDIISVYVESSIYPEFRSAIIELIKLTNLTLMIQATMSPQQPFQTPTVAVQSKSARTFDRRCI